MRVRCLPLPMVCLGMALLAGSLTAAEPTAAQRKFFETHVRPLLAEHCFKCHGPEKQRGSLRLDSLGGMLAGGESGPALVAGKPDESLLVEAINYASYEMPPTGQLKDEQIAILTRWVEMGAPWPGAKAGVPVRTAAKPRITDEDRAWWAFQPVRDPAVPQVADEGWSRNDIDRFVFRKLDEAGLHPSPEADKRTLIRRLSFDLTGLPPTPDEIDAFLTDESPRAYERLVDRLLDSPRYGEKWARHWLDLVRYAESDGYRQDAYRPHAWRYRDYVIRSFNADKPYDRFVMEQLAGDEIAPDDPDALVATGYLRHGIYEYNQRDVRTQWDTILNDVTDVTGDVFLGLGMGCARCHDHKFDPILQKDYFRLRAFFAPLLPRDDVPIATPQQKAEYQRELAAWEEKTADLRRQIAALEAEGRRIRADQSIDRFPPDIQSMIRKPGAERTPFEHQLAELAYRQVDEYVRTRFEYTSKEAKARAEALKKELAAFDSDKPAPLPEGDTVTDVGPVAPPTVIPGDRDAEEIAPGFLTLLDPEPADIEPISTAPDSTGRRTALARWITDPDNPLTTRVIVNRIWQYHFGTGLVATSSDFGQLGEPPSHPDLLDWLTKRFVEDGWRFKPLHRRIVLSATYRQSAEWGVRNVESESSNPHSAFRTPHSIDPSNRLLWRANVRRLEAESIRDAMLAVSGQLDLTPGGPGVGTDRPRRSIYTTVIRNTRDPLLDAFDVAERFTSTAQRNVTTTPTQSLLMINGEWPLQRAKAFAARLSESGHTSPEALVTQAYRLTYGRTPEPDELRAAVAFLESQTRGTADPDRPAADLVTATMPHTGNQAARLDPKNSHSRLFVPPSSQLPAGDFTVEAVFLLESLYEDATVRVIASQWDGDNNHPGWAFGVTSAKSNYQPRNLILQLAGQNAAGTHTHEVLASNLRPELNRPYYAAVTVHMRDTQPSGVTFYLMDLSDQNAVLQTAHVPHQVVADARSPVALVIGDRDNPRPSAWDGLIDEIRLSGGVLAADELLVNGGISPALAAHWRFESQPAVLADASGHGLDLKTNATTPTDARTAALVDFCHVLLNSSEFLYVD